MTHELKLAEGFYLDIVRGKKTFEFRKNDRDPKYEVGDILKLMEWNGKEYTGRQIACLVTYILEEGFGIPEGYCIMSIVVIENNV